VYIKYLLATCPKMFHDPRYKNTALGRYTYVVTFAELLQQFKNTALGRYTYVVTFAELLPHTCVSLPLRDVST